MITVLLFFCDQHNHMRDNYTNYWIINLTSWMERLFLLNSTVHLPIRAFFVFIPHHQTSSFATMLIIMSTSSNTISTVVAGPLLSLSISVNIFKAAVLPLPLSSTMSLQYANASWSLRWFCYCLLLQCVNRVKLLVLFHAVGTMLCFQFKPRPLDWPSWNTCCLFISQMKQS